MVDDIVGISSDEDTERPLEAQAQQPATTPEDNVESNAKPFFYDKKQILQARLDAREAALSAQRLRELRDELNKGEGIKYCMFTGPQAPDIDLAIKTLILISCVNKEENIDIHIDGNLKVDGFNVLKFRENTKLKQVDDLTAVTVYVRFYLPSNGHITSMEVYKALVKKGGERLQKISQVMFEAFYLYRKPYSAYLWVASVTFCLYESMNNKHAEDADLFEEMFIGITRGVPQYTVHWNESGASCTEVPSANEGPTSFKFDGFPSNFEATIEKGVVDDARKMVNAYVREELAP
eukprot:GHVS01076889.1.p1 GENE.GHVS01076889.1~~GHVS01076889.1.p1  ORF type:complete len:333 (+),score=28.39 GHVS01076889.1:122-1000(+)